MNIPSFEHLERLVAHRVSSASAEDLRSVVQYVLAQIDNDKHQLPGFLKVSADPSLQERYLGLLIDEALWSLELGRYVPGLTAQSPDEAAIERHAIRLARLKYGLSMADAERVAEQACTKIVRAVQKRPHLVRHFVMQPDTLGSYVRTTVDRLCIDLKRHNVERDRGARQAFIARNTDHGTDSHIDEYRSLLDQACDEAGLTETEHRRLTKVRQNMTNSAIAREEGVSETAIRKSVKTARNKVVDWLTNESSAANRRVGDPQEL